MPSKYQWKSEKSRMLRVFRMSRTAKERAEWTRNIGAGFILDDIQNIVEKDGAFFVFSQDGLICSGKPIDFNLRETDEIIKYLTYNGAR